MTLGERLRALREGKGMSLAELGKELDLSAPFLYTIETNKKGPSTDTLKKIADFFHVTTDYLLFGKETIPAPEDPELKEIYDQLKGLDPHDRQMIWDFVQARHERLKKEGKI